MPSISRYRAPIQYDDVRRSYNNVRIVGGILMATVAVLATFQEAASGPYVLVGGLVVAIDAVYERWRGTSALRPLMMDATVLGVISLMRGYSGGTEGAGIIYLVTGALLLLPLRRAIGILTYTALWAIPVGVLGPLLDPGDDSLLAEVGAIVAFAGIVARLLYATGQALFAAEQRHRDALEAEKRAVELKDEFVSMVSHELRTPLTSIVGFAGTLRGSWAKLPEKEVDEFLVIMRAEANHLANLVEDILVIPRLEAGRLRLEPETIGLRDEAYEVAQLVFAGTTREIQVDVPADIYVTADPNRLRQIFRNLLENARKYGGDQVLITGERAGYSYKVVIADNGQGIPVEDRERIFEHFEQAVKGDARSEGVGLGLPIARKLTRAMGGDLWFEPRFPTGAQFLFTVQTAPETETPPATVVSPDNITPIR
ncbi:MAG: HAMP domain-containing histidine kinase, partial [bacterium]|nr:HAMP domain-containing histidine kinase [bacterium]